MKSKILSLALAAVLTSSVSFAKVWRVNNNGGVNANFTTAQAAVTSSSVVNGDTLYFEGSNSSYGDISDLNKSLTLIGTGYFLGSWSPSVQFTPISAKIGSISSVSASNVLLLGLEITGNIYLYTGNTQILRCSVGNINFWGPNSNIVIKQNWIGSIGASGGEVVTNLLMSNNLIAYGFSVHSGNDNGVIEYNSFGINGSGTINLNNGNFSFRNNIIAGSGAVQNYTGSSVQYNIAQTNTLPANNNNQNSVAMAGSAVFVNNDYNSGDKNFQLSPNSPALTAGAGSTPIGAFAGVSPYVFSGIPPIPTIYSLSLPAATSTGSTIQVTFSSKSNN